MLEELARAIPVYFSSMLKFILGPVGGYLAKLSMVTTILTTVAGMMTVVLAFAFFGDLIKKYVIDRYFKRGRGCAYAAAVYANRWCVACCGVWKSPR